MSQQKKEGAISDHTSDMFSSMSGNTFATHKITVRNLESGYLVPSVDRVHFGISTLH